MLFLVIGCGSIGMRHIRNLKMLTAGTITAFDIVEEKRRFVETEYGIKTYDNLEEALATAPDAVLICTPPAFHIGPALQSAKAGCHLFIEKPVSHTLDGLDELSSIVTKKNLITFVACNMRFYDGVARVRKMLDESRIGKIYSARVLAGWYLPDWHPKDDYRKTYSARASMGGGVLLDGIHEIDFISWFFGDAEGVFCFSDKYSSLDIETEDMAEILIKFSSGTIAEIHLDYLQRAYGRSFQLIGENGTIVWNFNEKMVRFFSTDDGKWHEYPEPPGYDLNQMYVEEMKYFINCIKTRQHTMNDLEGGIKVLKLVLAAKESAGAGILVSINND